MTRFSPVSNGQPDLPTERQTRILVATDVLSEGQNLQDCGRVLNYDRHWNPVTLIQRYGRVGRITTEHEVIHLHNMLPDAGVDRQIGLTGRLSARAQSFHDLIGWTTPSCNRRSGSAGPASTGLRAARAARAVADAADAAGLAAGDTLALTANGSVRQGCRVDAGLTAHPLSHAETARLARCEPGVPAVALPPNINRRVQAALTAFGRRRPATAAGAAAGAAAETRERITANARYIARELGQLRLGQRAAGDLTDTERLRAAFTGELPAGVNDRIGQLRRDGVHGAALRDALTELAARLPAGDAAATVSAPAATAGGGIKVVGSMSAT